MDECDADECRLTVASFATSLAAAAAVASAAATVLMLELRIEIDLLQTNEDFDGIQSVLSFSKPFTIISCSVYFALSYI